MKKESFSELKEFYPPKQFDEQKNAPNWLSKAETSYEFSIWVGAIIYHLKDQMELPFENYYATQFRQRNLWAGYLLQLFIAIYAVVFIFLFFLYLGHFH